MRADVPDVLAVRSPRGLRMDPSRLALRPMRSAGCRMTLPACAAMPTRCSHGYDPVQAPIHTCAELVALAKSRGITSANAAAPDDVKARIDAAIRRWAAKGVEFSSNDVRPEFADVTGPIVGARFNAAAKAGVIVDTGKRVPSTLASTKGHEVRRWRGAEAARWHETGRAS